MLKPKINTFYRSYYTGDAKIQRVFSKESLAKRPKQPLHPKAIGLLQAPDPNLFLPTPPKESEPEMMDLGSQNEE